jgi:hypothetical protein
LLSARAGNGDIRITVWDETNIRIRPDEIIERIRESGGRGLVGLVGVQTNQFPRAVDLARPLRAAGIPVVIGGFHVSGCIAMLPDLPPDLQDAMDSGITLFAGEAEGQLDDLLRTAYRNELRPLYNFMNDWAGGAATRHLPLTSFAVPPALDELRRRARLPVPVQLLHDHQRSGAEIARTQRRRRRAADPRQSVPGRAQLLHHRRQPGAESELGGDLRSIDQDA